MYTRNQYPWRGVKGKEEKWNDMSDSDHDTNITTTITSVNLDCSLSHMEELNLRVMSLKVKQQVAEAGHRLQRCHFFFFN